MAYPSAPWTLRGFAFQTVQPLDIDRVRPSVPSDLEIVSIFPGKTLGGIYVSSYGSTSTLQYSELIVVSALVRQGARLGAWISHIYVDNPDSVAGGRDIWSLPKEEAQFEWQPGKPHCVTVRQGDRTLCRINTSWQASIPGISLPGLPIPIAMGAFSASDTHLLWFPARGMLNLTPVTATVEVPIGSPFYAFDIDRPWQTLYGDNLNLTIDAPSVVGTRTAAYRYS
jgi:hypothetical protein